MKSEHEHLEQSIKEAAESRRRWQGQAMPDAEEEEEEEDDEDAMICVYYCVGCGQLSLVLGARLKDQPVRDLDESIILSERQYKVQVLTEVEKLTLINFAEESTPATEAKIERQWRIHCKGCDLPLMYRHESSEVRSESGMQYPFTYVLKNALTDNPSAIELELRHERDKIIALRKQSEEEQ